MSDKYVLRIWTSGLEYDQVVTATLGGKRIGGGYSFGDCSRDIDFEYESAAERDAAFDKATLLFPNFKVERRA